MLKKIIKMFLNKEFIKFCFVGLMGTVTDMGTLAILKKIFEVPHNSLLEHIIWLPGYFAAIVQNYIVNHFWTFKAHEKNQKVSHKALIKFALISFTSTIPRAITYEAVLWLFKELWFKVYAANFMGIVAGTVVNYFGSKFIVFKNQK